MALANRLHQRLIQRPARCCGLEKYLAEQRPWKPLRELIKLRASQINGCAYCIDMHWKDARPPARASSVSTGWPRGAKRLITANGARGAGVDRRVDLDRRASCLGRAVRTDTPAVQRTGTRRSHAGGGDHQRLESHCHQFSFRSRLAPAAGARVRWRDCVLSGGRTNAQSMRFRGRDPSMPIEGITDLSSLRSGAA